MVYARGVDAGQPDREVVVKGPPANRAFDAEGRLTPAGEGFARGKGIDPAVLQVREMDGGTYAAAVVHEKGRRAVDIFAAELPGLVAKIKFDKSMRWNSSRVAFSRPIRWFLALFGATVVNFEYAGIRSANITRGLRFLEPREQPVASAQEYFSFLQSQSILLDPVARRDAIRQQVAALMQQAGADVAVDEGLLDEVANLVEAPTAMLGEFEPEHLKLPADVLISVMKKHQRYFPVLKGGQLLPCFILVRNGDDRHAASVADGNAQVIRARFADAAFFVEEDLRASLESYLPRLGTLTFQLKLGSMLDKTGRVSAIVEDLLPALKISGADAETARRAARLCKADLVTRMVVEMTSLQGIMGRYYARRSGEPEAVAEAIYEHYLPRGGSDDCPASPAGLVVGMADRLDTLAGLFAAGLAPTGTKDPFAQRRAALGLVQILIQRGLNFDLRAGLAAAASHLPIPAGDQAQAACLDFIIGRLRSLLLEQGYRYDVLDAVLPACGHNPALAARNARELTAAISQPDWPASLQAYARCVRITRDSKERYNVAPAAFAHEAEAGLYAAVQACEAQAPFASVDAFLSAFKPAIGSIDSFFEAVMVMAEDPALRANRLGLLQRVAALPAGLADLSKLEGF